MKYAFQGARGLKNKRAREGKMQEIQGRGGRMGVSLNIIEHELSDLGRVVRSEGAQGTYAAVRLYLASDSALSEDFLYLCDDADDPGRHSDFAFLYVGGVDGEPARAAVLSILSDCSMLEILNMLSDVMFRYAQWERALDESCFASEGIQALLDVSTPFLRNNVVVVDPALKLLAYSKDVPCDDPITMELIKHGYHTEENIKKFRLNKRFEPWATQEGFIVNDTRRICKYVTVVYSFKTRNSFSVIIIMMCNVVNPAEWLYDAFGLFIRRVERYVAKEYPDEKPSGNMTDAFLRDLVEGRLSDEASVRERCIHVGIPFESRFCMFYLEPDSDDQALMPRVLADVSRVVAPAKTFLSGRGLAILCFNCRSDACALHCMAGTCPVSGASISSRLSELLIRYGMACGRSSKFTVLLDARVAFLQAVQACAMGRRAAKSDASLVDRQNWKGIFSFDGLALDYLVESEVARGEELFGATYACRVLADIAAGDERAKTDNYLFLRAYLTCERRASVVAERLHMHRNNVKYRITRIEDVYGIDTEDPDTRFDLMLAYRIRDALTVQNAQ